MMSSFPLLASVHHVRPGGVRHGARGGGLGCFVIVTLELFFVVKIVQPLQLLLVNDIVVNVANVATSASALATTNGSLALMKSLIINNNNMLIVIIIKAQCLGLENIQGAVPGKFEGENQGGDSESVV